MDNFDRNRRLGFLTTKERATPIHEAIEFLKKQTPMKALRLDRGLNAAAFRHSEYMASISKATNEGKGDMTGYNQRIESLGLTNG